MNVETSNSDDSLHFKPAVEQILLIIGTLISCETDILLSPFHS